MNEKTKDLEDIQAPLSMYVERALFLFGVVSDEMDEIDPVHADPCDLRCVFPRIENYLYIIGDYLSMIEKHTKELEGMASRQLKEHQNQITA